jgi:predicted dehydrogenase
VNGPALHPTPCAVVGAGGFGRLHALTLQRLPEARLVGIVDRSPLALAELPESLAAIDRWTDINEALRHCEAHLWVVATPTPTHVALAEALLRQGKVVLVEKPLAMHVAEAQRLAPLVREESSNLLVGHVALFGSEFRQLQAEARARAPIAYLDAARHRPTTALAQYPDDTPLYLTMVHDLYLVDALMQGVEPCVMEARYHRTADGHVDLVLARLEWPGGGVGRFAASFMTPAGMPADGYNRLEVFGEGWAARICDNPRPLTVWGDRAEWPLGLDLLADGTHACGILAEELRHACAVTQGREPVMQGLRFADALRIQNWLARLEASAAG